MHTILIKSIETASVFLEIVAFFCVTIELYGKTRLAAAHDSLMERLSAISVTSHATAIVKKSEYDYWSKESTNFAIKYGFAVAGYAILAAALGYFLPGTWTTDKIMIYLVVCVGAFSLIAVTIREYIAAAKLITYMVLAIAVRRMLQDVATERLEGWLLYRGAILFIISKGFHLALSWL